jgi:hypothetical protein
MEKQKTQYLTLAVMKELGEKLKKQCSSNKEEEEEQKKQIQPSRSTKRA